MQYNGTTIKLVTVDNIEMDRAGTTDRLIRLLPWVSSSIPFLRLMHCTDHRPPIVRRNCDRKNRESVHMKGVGARYYAPCRLMEFSGY